MSVFQRWEGRLLLTFATFIKFKDLFLNLSCENLSYLNFSCSVEKFQFERNNERFIIFHAYVIT